MDDVDKDTHRVLCNKDGRYINYYIDREIYERLKKYADDRGQTMTIAVERILKAYLDEQENKSTE